MDTEPTDEQLLADITAADGRSLRRLLDRHGRYLYGIARTLTRNDAEAEDAVQETLVALLSAEFRGASSAKTFLVSILIRQAALIRRKRKWWLRIVPTYDEPPSRGTGHEQTVDAKLDLAALLDRLSPEHREVIVMRELQSMTYDEIAEAMDVPRGTVESRLHRARQQLQQLWKQ